jgi:hypothetical protein
VASYGVNAIFVFCCTIFYVAKSLREISGLQIVRNVASSRQALLTKWYANKIENNDLFGVLALRNLLSYLFRGEVGLI